MIISHQFVNLCYHMEKNCDMSLGIVRGGGVVRGELYGGDCPWGISEEVECRDTKNQFLFIRKT